MTDMKREKTFEILSFAGFFVVIVFFFVICRFGFFVSDDWAMGIGLSSLKEVLASTRWFYLHWGGGVFGAFSQYLFCGLWNDNKLWFDLANTIVFLLTLLLCGKMVATSKKVYWRCVLLFSLLLWFLAPRPSEVFFWPVGSIGYLWTMLPILVFMYLYDRYKNENLPLGKQLVLMLVSIATVSGLSCLSICGALVLYYLFNYKELNRTVVLMFIGFLLGSLVLVFAPGNFARSGTGTGGGFDVVAYVLAALSPMNVMRELLKYKALWLLVVSMVFLFVHNKKVAKEWCRQNAFLLLVLGLSVVECSVVFSQYISSTRTLLFPELLSIALFLKIIMYLFTDSYAQCRFEKDTIFHYLSRKANAIGIVVVLLLFGAFSVDAAKAVDETKKQRENNDRFLSEIYLAGGVASVDVPVPLHRMAYAPTFPRWAWEGMAQKMGLDSVHVYPFYCQGKYFEAPLRFDENVFVDKLGRYDGQGMVVIRSLETDSSEYHCQIDYDRPRKWYRVWLDKLRHYRYSRSVEVGIEKEGLCFEGYRYHVIWMDKENCEGIKRVEVREK